MMRSPGSFSDGFFDAMAVSFLEKKRSDAEPGTQTEHRQRTAIPLDDL